MAFIPILGLLVCLSSGYEAFLLDDATTTSAPKGNNITTGCTSEVFLDCSKDYQKILNLEGSSGNVSLDSLMNFTCGSGMDKMIDCVSNRVAPYCGNANDTSSVAYQFVRDILPGLNSSREYCNGDLDLDEYKKFGECALKFSTSQSYIDCVTGETLNKTDDLTNICKLTKMGTACTYKYTDLVCPEFLPTFLKSANMSTNTQCEMTFDKEPEVTSCDEDLRKVCTLRNAEVASTDNAELIVEYTCSNATLATRLCAEKVDKLCGASGSSGIITSSSSTGTSNPQSASNTMTSFLPSIELTREMCTHKDDYKAFAKCYGVIDNDDDYNACRSDNKTDVCDRIQKINNCTAAALLKHCSSSVSSFFTKYVTKLFEQQAQSAMFPNCSLPHVNGGVTTINAKFLILPTATTTTTSMPVKGATTTSSMPVQMETTQIMATMSGIHGADRSYILSVLSHVQKQVGYLKMHVQDLDEEANLLQSLLKGPGKL